MNWWQISLLWMVIGLSLLLNDIQPDRDFYKAKITTIADFIILVFLRCLFGSVILAIVLFGYLTSKNIDFFKELQWLTASLK